MKDIFSNEYPEQVILPLGTMPCICDIAQDQPPSRGYKAYLLQRCVHLVYIGYLGRVSDRDHIWPESHQLGMEIDVDLMRPPRPDPAESWKVGEPRQKGSGYPAKSYPCVIEVKRDG